MDVIHLTPTDIAANQKGQLSANQRSLLKRQRYFWIAGSLSLLVLVLSLTAVLILKFTTPTFANRGQLFIILPLCLLWLWLLRKMPNQWLQTNKDLQEGAVAVLENSVNCHFDLTIGMIQFVRYYLQVGKHDFRLTKELYDQFKNKERYRIYYAPHSITFLGAMPLVQPNQLGVEAKTNSEQLVEPLSARELEILALLAAGLSNKEIANQLSLSVNTIKMYASQIYQKLGVNRRTEAVAQARKFGLLS